MMSTKYFAYMVYILYPHESDFKKLGAAGWHAPSLKIIFSVESFYYYILYIYIFKPGASRLHAWFLEITFNARVYACVYAPEAINN